MKFTININQEKLIQIEPRAKLVDGAILDYLYWLCNSNSEAVEKLRKKDSEGLRYTWVNYGHLLDDMPLLGGKSRASLTPVFKRLESWGFIKTMIMGHQMKYVALLPKTDELLRKSNSPVKKTKQSCSENLTYNNTNDNYTKKKSSSFFKKKKNPYYMGEETRKSHGKRWVIPSDGGPWLEFVGKESELEWK